MKNIEIDDVTYDKLVKIVEEFEGGKKASGGFDTGRSAINYMMGFIASYDEKFWIIVWPNRPWPKNRRK